MSSAQQRTVSRTYFPVNPIGHHAFCMMGVSALSKYVNKDPGDAARKEANKRIPVAGKKPGDPPTMERQYNRGDFVYVWDKSRDKSQIRAYQIKSREETSVFRTINGVKKEQKVVTTKLMYVGYYPVDRTKTGQRDVESIYTSAFVVYRRAEGSTKIKATELKASPASITLHNKPRPTARTGKPAKLAHKTARKPQTGAPSGQQPRHSNAPLSGAPNRYSFHGSAQSRPPSTPKRK